MNDAIVFVLCCTGVSTFLLGVAAAYRLVVDAHCALKLGGRARSGTAHSTEPKWVPINPDMDEHDRIRNLLTEIQGKKYAPPLVGKRPKPPPEPPAPFSRPKQSRSIVPFPIRLPVAKKDASGVADAAETTKKDES